MVNSMTVRGFLSALKVPFLRCRSMKDSKAMKVAMSSKSHPHILVRTVSPTPEVTARRTYKPSTIAKQKKSQRG